MTAFEFRLAEGTLSYHGHRWDYETWTADTYRSWAAHYRETADDVELGGEG